MELAKDALTELADAMAAEVQPSIQWLAELDVTSALAEVAQQHGFSKPELVEESVLEIDKGVQCHGEDWTKPGTEGWHA